MKSHRPGKKENSREAKEAKESEEKQRKVSTEELPKPKTPNDLNLAIAEMVYNRQPYHVIAHKLKVSPKTISKAKKKIEEGTIKIAENGKAIYNKNSESIEIGPLSKQLQMEILGAAHLEGKSPQDLIAGLIRLDRKMRLKGLNLSQLESAAEFIEKAYPRGWTMDLLIDVLTRLQNSGFSDLNEQSIGLLCEFLDCAKRRNLSPEHIMKVAQKKEDDWRRANQQAQETGYQDGIKHYREWIVKLAVETYRKEDNGFERARARELDRLLDSAEQRAMGHVRTPE
jgi:hypothetical protein